MFKLIKKYPFLSTVGFYFYGLTFYKMFTGVSKEDIASAPVAVIFLMGVFFMLNRNHQEYEERIKDLETVVYTLHLKSEGDK